MARGEETRCPSCGAPIPIKNRFIRMVACDFCGNVSIVTIEGLDPTGQQAGLHEQARLLFTDALGSIDGRAFRTAGRLRYQTEDVYWDEWLLEFEDGDPGWLAEDEGTCKLYMKETVTADAPPFSQIRVGMELELAGETMFVTEIGSATIAGGEGQVAIPILPGETIHFVDAVAGDRIASIEYHGDEVELSVGMELDPAAIEIQDDYMKGFDDYV